MYFIFFSQNSMKFAHLHKICMCKNSKYLAMLYKLLVICWLKSRHSKVTETVFILKFSTVVAKFEF